MLRHTFCHLPGIGTKTEEDLWRAGIRTWDDFLADCRPARHYPARPTWEQQIRASICEYDRGNPAYFSELLQAKHRWRLFKDFAGSCAYLDIETTGLGGPGDHITTIALYDGEYLRCYIHGVNLDEFPADVQKYRLLVTYNGATFDLPFLERQFRTKLSHAHVDLRYVLRALGYSGGLKKCEQTLGVLRPGMEDLDGSAAVLLWHEYRRKNDPRALETLLAYNVQDTINLETLMILAYNRKVLETPFAAQHALAEKPTPHNPYTPDPALVRKVVGMLGGVRVRFES